MHFGEKDQGIPMTDVAAIKANRPESEIYVYRCAARLPLRRARKLQRTAAKTGVAAHDGIPEEAREK